MSDKLLPSQFEEIAPGVYAVLTQHSGKSFEDWVAAGFAPNAGFILTDDGVVVVDPRMLPAQGEEVKAKVRELTDQPIRYVINTHWHNDHLFGSEAFIPATFICSRETYDALQYMQQFDIVRVWARDPLFAPIADALEKITLVMPNIAFDGELILDVGGRRIELLQIGGETSDTIVVWLPEEEVLFASDVVMNGVPPYLADPTSSVNGWIEALEVVEQLAPRVIVPGHGPLADVGTARAMRHMLEDYRRQVVDLILQGKSVEEIKAQVQLPEYPDYPWYPREALLAGVDVIYRELKR